MFLEKYTNLIGDKSTVLDNNHYNQWHKQDQPNQDQQKNGFRVLSPEEPIKIFWDMLGMLFIFIQMITIPLIITFSLDISDYDFSYFSNIMDYYFMVDILIQFQVAYFSKGNLIIERRKIAKNYLKCWFWIDLISSFPYDIVISATASETTNVAELQRNAQIIKAIRFVRFIKIIRLVRALKLKKFIDQLEQQLFMDNKAFSSLISFLKICILILCLAHWCACIWNSIRIIEEAPINWYSNKSQEDDWQLQYIAGIYFSITTMITIGYGDYHPYTTNEKVFGIFVMILSSGLFGYVMNMIVTIFQNQDVNLQNILDKNDLLIDYMKQKKEIQPNLQQRIKNYLEWLAEQEQVQRSYEQLTLQTLSINLRKELQQIVHGNMMKYVHIFSDNFSQNTCSKLAYIFQEQIYNPEQIIISQSDQINGSTQVFYIQNGNVIITCVRERIAQLSKLQYFGEISFFANVPRSATAKAMGFLTLYSVKREEFRKILTIEDQEKFFEIKFAIEFEENLMHLNIKCHFCEGEGHVAKYCPEAHYNFGKFEKLVMIKKNIESMRQNIKSIRKKKIKTNSLELLSNKDIVKALNKLKVEMPNTQYFLQKKNLYQEIQKPMKIRESFVSDTVKEFSGFTPDSNFNVLMNTQNALAELKLQYIKQIKAERKVKITQSKFLGFLQKRSKPQNKFQSVINLAIKQKQQSLYPDQDELSEHHQINHNQFTHNNEQQSKKLKRLSSEEGSRNRLKQVLLKRRETLSFESMNFNKLPSFLEFPEIPEDALESPAQDLKETKKFIFYTAKSNKSSVSTSETFVFPDLYINGTSRRSQSEPIKNGKVQFRYTKQQLEDMIYIVINHRLFNCK